MQSDFRFTIPSYTRFHVEFSEGTMSRKILTFGYDACHRWAVLRLAGYTVHVCESIGELRDRLMKRSHVDAVIMVEDIVNIPEEAITAAKSYFQGPLILFQARSRSAYKESFDLCVPILSGPSVWLPKLEALLDTIQQKTKSASTTPQTTEKSTAR